MKKRNFVLILSIDKFGMDHDSGASCHICNRRENFISMNSRSRKIAVANGIEEIAVGIRTVRVSCLNNKNLIVKDKRRCTFCPNTRKKVIVN